MTSAAASKDRKILHPDFALRMEQAADQNQKVPPKNHGRYVWIVDQFDKRFGEKQLKENVRKWFYGEAKPREKTLKKLAQILEVDDVWLSLGRTSSISEKQRRARNAMADGAVNVVAGFVQMCGGHPAFPDADDERASRHAIDLYAVIKGAQYSFHVVAGEPADDGSWKFSIPSAAVDQAVIVGVMQREPLRCEFIEIRSEDIEEHGTAKSGTAIYSVNPSNETPPIHWITTFGERL